MRDTGASCLACGFGGFSGGVRDLAGADALAEELAEPELLEELDDRDVDPLLDDDLDLLPEELSESLSITINRHTCEPQEMCFGSLYTSAVRIVFFHFESNQIVGLLFKNLN